MPKIRAEVLSYSKINDLALLKVNASTTKHIKPIENLEQSQIEFNKMIPGEKVHVIGNPLSQYCSYGSGEVSQIRSNYEWSYDEFYRDLKAEVIQTNAPILSGNSGIPMFNKGRKFNRNKYFCL